MTSDVLVIGGGPAGMFAAITAAEQGCKVTLLERNDRLGKKLLITGKGRCNVTNNCSAEEVLQNTPRNGRFLYSAMTAFPPEKTMAFFEQAGCPLKTERGNRVFPQSDSAGSILDCLKRKMRETGVTVRTGRVLEITTREGRVTGVRTETEALEAKTVILATGGCSYPTTGSTGDGYRMAAALGHTVVAPQGSLVPLEEAGEDCPKMQGLSLRNVGVKLVNAKGKVLYKDFGELLFTHFGVSGPTVLSASCHLKGEACRLVLDRLNIPRDLQANSLTKQSRHALVMLLKAFPVEIKGKRPVAEAIITSGGIKTGEVDPKTMASKKIEGLYFAGEILDCDAYTGGFNLQIAWATAYGAALGVKAELAIDKSRPL